MDGKHSDVLRIDRWTNGPKIEHGAKTGAQKLKPLPKEVSVNRATVYLEWTGCSKINWLL